jgi:hypothetical protein
VTGPKGIGPGPAAAKARGIAGAVDVATRAFTGINAAMREYDITQSKVRVDNAVTQWYTDNANRDSYTPDEIRSAGLADQVQLTEGVDEAGNTLQREVIPAHEVQHLMLSKAYERAIKGAGSGISNTQDLNLWTQDMNANRDKAVMQAAVAARGKAVEWKNKERDVVIAQSQAAGNFDGAADLIRGRYMNKGIRAAALQENAEMKEEHEQMLWSQTATPSQLRERAKEMVTEDAIADSARSSEEMNASAGRLISLAGVKERESKALGKEIYQAGVNAHWQQYYQDPAALLANMPLNFNEEDIRSVVSFAEKTAGGGAVKTNLATWANLTDLSNDPAREEKWRETNLLQYQDRIASAQWMTLFNDQQEAKQIHRGEGDPESYATNKQMIDAGLDMMNIRLTGTSGASERAAMVPVFASALEAEEAARGVQGKPKMNSSEKMAVINGIVDVELTVKGKLRTVVPWDDSEQIRRVNSGLITLNEPVNAENANAYNHLEDEDLPTTLENLQAARWLLKNNSLVTESSVEAAKEMAKNAQLK